MSTFAKKVTSAVAGLAVVFSIVSPIAGVSAAYSSLDAANKLATLGVIVDQSANPSAYRLADTTSREELSKVIANLGGLVVVEGEESVYADTNFADWAEKYARALNQAGYAASNEFFNPKFNATKIEALKWVMEARNIASGEGDNWMEQRVNGAVEAGIATPFTDYNAEASRGQVFIWAAEAIDAGEEVTIDDDLLCSILGTCDDDDVVDPTDPTDPTEPTTPVTGGTAEVSLSPLTPTAGVVAGGLSRTSFLAFDVTAGNTDVTLKDLTLSYVGLSDYSDFSELAIYRGSKEVSRSQKKFNNDEEADISFENDVVVQAGETVTFMVAGKVDTASGTVAHQIELTELNTSADVIMGNVRSVVFNVLTVSNTAALTVDENTTDSTITVGEEVTFSDFSLEEKLDNEDVVVKSITFTFDGTADFEDDVTDLVLTADGEVIADGLMVDNDDEVVVELDYLIDADSEVDFELLGGVSGSIADTVEVNVSEVYAIGADTGVIAQITYDTSFNATVAVIDGSEINASFDKSDIDEAKPGAEDVLVGTFNLDSDGDYTINKINVRVQSTNGSGVLDILDRLELDGRAFDSEDSTSNADIDVNYVFEDVTLNNESLELELVAEIIDNVNLNGQALDFTISITEIEDEENDETYTLANVTDVLSTNSFKTKSIDIEAASIRLTQSNVSARDLVLGNGIEVVLYQGKINVGDASDVTLVDLDLNGTATGSFDFKDIIDSATLNIGGVTADADVKTGSLEFNNADITVASGAKNVEVLISAVLKDFDGITGGESFSFDVNSISAEDEDGEDLIASSITINSSANDAVITMNNTGTLTVAVVRNGDYKDDIEDVVLAGTSNVTLAELTLEAEEEDVDVNELTFVINGDFVDTIEDARIMAGSTVIADGGVVTLSGSTTEILFEDFTVEDTGSEIAATLVVDLNIITNEGGVVSANAGDIVVSALTTNNVDAEGASSNDDIPATLAGDNANSTAVSVVPALVTVSVSDSFGEGDLTAAIEINLDMGDNDLNNDDVTAQSMRLSNNANLIAEIINIDNNDEVLYSAGTTGSISGQVITFATGAEIVDGDRLEIRIDSGAAAVDTSYLMEILRGSDAGFVYTVDGDNYNVTNESRTALGTYKR